MIDLIITPILLTIALLLLLVIIVSLLYFFDFFLVLPYVATDRKKIKTITKLSGIKKGETAIDLGSGDGRLLFACAQKGAKAIGYEINPVLVAISVIVAKLKGFSKLVSVKRKNLWKANLKEADVIFVYGRQNTMKKFEKFVYKNAKKGTRVVVNSDKTKPFPTKKPKKKENGAYLYKV